MRFFSKNRISAGWMAIVPDAEGVRVARVVRPASGRPIVETAMFVALGGEAPAAALEKINKELRLASYRSTTLLAGHEYQMLSVDAPNVPANELKTAIRWRLKDMLDYRVEEATIDVLDVPAEANAGARTHGLYAIAARNSLIAQRQALFADAKIPLRVIDIPEMAQRNISALLESDGRGSAMLSFGRDGGLLTVTYKGELYLTRRIDIPLSQLETEDPGQRSASAERITLELQRSLDHFDRQYHFIAVPKLILAPLSGGAAAGLLDSLRANLYIPVETLDLATVLDLTKVPELTSLQTQQRYFITLGAALRQEESA